MHLPQIRLSLTCQDVESVPLTMPDVVDHGEQYSSAGSCGVVAPQKAYM